MTFYAYRVFGCGVPVGGGVSTDTDILLAAIEQAGLAKVDVVNMSIGASFVWPQYPTAQASDRLVRMGTVVVASIGNSGATGTYSASAPGVGETVIGVASFDNTHVRLPMFQISPDGQPIGITPATGGALFPTSGSLPIRRTGPWRARSTHAAARCRQRLPPLAASPARQHSSGAAAADSTRRRSTPRRQAQWR